MEDIVAGPELVGRKVTVAARPEWGVGAVTKVEPTTASGQAVHRVTIEFPVSGVKKLVVPPARLLLPQSEQERTVGWLEALGGRAPNDVLRKLPAEATDVLGTLAARLRAVARYYRYDPDDPKSLIRWATDQTRLPDPLSQWSRDELARAFQDFALDRDGHLRAIAARVRIAEGEAGLRAALAELEEPLATRVREALGRPI